MKHNPVLEINTSKLPDPMLEHEIRLRAYELYEQRGRRDGRALEDWLQAEAEVARKLSLSGDLWNIRR